MLYKKHCKSILNNYGNDTSCRRQCNHIAESKGYFKRKIRSSFWQMEQLWPKGFLNKKTVNLILLDLWMPEENGMELLEEIRGNENYKDIPMVFLTSEVDNRIEARCIEIGADDFVNKPIAPTVFNG